MVLEGGLIDSNTCGSILLNYLIKTPGQMASKNRKEPLLYMEEYRVKQDPQDYGLADDVFSVQAFKEKLHIKIVR